IAGIVSSGSGIVTVILTGTDGGKLGLDPQLDFFNKSFFSCAIGSSVFTNDNITKLGTAIPLNTTGVTTIIKDVTGHTDTIRTIWPDAVTHNQNGVDIIQDVWCIPLGKSVTNMMPYANAAQVVMSWKFRNNSNKAQAVV